VVKYDEFLHLSPEEVIKLISHSDLAVSKEECVRKLKLLLIFIMNQNLKMAQNLTYTLFK